MPKAFKGLVDTHTHLCDAVFDKDRDEVLERARNAGVGAIILVSENISDAKKNLDLASKYPMLRPAAGHYPGILDKLQAEDMEAFIRKRHDQWVAVGEVGLDHWVAKTESERAVQTEIFKTFIHLSKELELPLNVHSRSAGRHAVSMLMACGATKVQLHAFDGKASAAMPAVEAGYFFSIPPSIVRSRQKQKLVKQLPLSCLLVETDSPVLGPLPDTRNEPANILMSIQAVAELKKVSEAEVIEAVLENTEKLYGNLF
jgi:TatD DNase family protein